VSGKQGFAEDYIPVNERIALFVAKYPEGSLRPLWPDEPYRVLGEGETKWLVYGACAYRWPDDSAAAIGIATNKSIASAEEVRSARERSQAPQRAGRPAASATPPPEPSAPHRAAESVSEQVPF
jgi:hypothetical protein